ncbi:hypothetical protein HMPREF9134_01027 [Porphyromonas catoniae F0037]|uniref:Uncharacterized protein n=1 Tax=Porphyromonas catoniae F0037 TaxID=1127696 RepID=L1NDB8_9PORP|nr:hypothetical protein HMPREF9134_01027 [Porphyromonas catoniae F0037]
MQASSCNACMGQLYLSTSAFTKIPPSSQITPKTNYVPLLP